MRLNEWSAGDYVSPILRSKQTRKNLLNSILGYLEIVLICWLLKIGISLLGLRTILSVVILFKIEIAYDYLEKFKQSFSNKV